MSAGQHPEADSVGKFPDRHDTVIAEVLADLLEGHEPTAMAAVRRCSTTRLAHQVFILRGRGWKIDTNDMPVDTVDGRVATVGKYSMLSASVEAARAAGSAAWCAKVRAARSARRGGGGS